MTDVIGGAFIVALVLGFGWLVYETIRRRFGSGRGPGS